MKQDFTLRILVNASPEKAFQCINNVTQWWTTNLKGSSHKLNDEFSVQFGDVHYSKQKLVECIPSKKIVWLVTESLLSFTENKQEWTGTTISFEITEKELQTEVCFTHHGLKPSVECFDACSGAWTEYIQDSLASLINTGKGQPT